MSNRFSYIASLASGTALFALAVAACNSSSASPSSETEVASNDPTFHETVQPIVQERCQSCHRAGGIAPFALETYEQVKAVAALANEKVAARQMPPWGAFDDDACKVQHKFKDDMRMTDAEIDTFGRWVAAGSPRGDAAKAPAPKTFGPSGLANKTHTFTAPTPFSVEGGSKDDIRCFPIDPGFTQDTWIAGSNVMPGDPRVVHHVIVYVDPDGEGPAKAQAAGGQSYPCFGGPGTSKPSLLLAWAPGVPPASYGDDAGLKVPKGSRLVMQVHYHADATTREDQTGFELRVLPTRPNFVSQILLIGNAESANGIIQLLPSEADPPSGPAFVIPANAAKHVESMQITIPTHLDGFPIPKLSILASGSHMHWAGVNMRIDIDRKTTAEGQPTNECLLGTPKYDFNWQRAYAYDEPFEKLPVVNPGDTLRFTCTYNNSTSNKYVEKALAEQRLPAPVDIKLGETTLDEMCLGALVVIRPATAID